MLVWRSWGGKEGGAAMPSLKLALNRILQEFCGAVVAFADRLSRP